MWLFHPDAADARISFEETKKHTRTAQIFSLCLSTYLFLALVIVIVSICSWWKTCFSKLKLQNIGVTVWYAPLVRQKARGAGQPVLCGGYCHGFVVQCGRECCFGKSRVSKGLTYQEMSETNLFPNAFYNLVFLALALVAMAQKLTVIIGRSPLNLTQIREIRFLLGQPH